MTVAELRTFFRDLVDDPDGGYFTSANTLVWLNLGQREVQKLLAQAFEGHNIRQATTLTVLNQKEYQLPSDFKRLHRLELVLSGTAPNEDIRRLTKITRNQQDLVSNQSGSPEYYNFQGNYLILYPAPNPASQTLRLHYEYRVADMSADGDSPDLPVEYHELVGLYAARKGLLKDGRDISTVQKEIDDFEANLKKDAEQRYVDEPRTIVQTQDDDGLW